MDLEAKASATSAENSISISDGSFTTAPESTNIIEEKENEEFENDLLQSLATYKDEDSEKRPKRVYRKKRDTSIVHINNVSSNPYKVRLPRIHPDDIRRKYPFILLNAMNIMDISSLLSFLELFTHENTILQRQVLSPHFQNRELERISFYGRTEIVRFAYLLSLFCPDRTLTIKKDPSIVTRSDTFRTEIILEGEGAGSWLFHSDPIKIGHFLLKLQNDFPEKLLTVDASHLEQLSFLDRLFRQHHQECFDAPQQILTKGRIILVINNFYESEEIDEIIIQSYGLHTEPESSSSPSPPSCCFSSGHLQ